MTNRFFHLAGRLIRKHRTGWVHAVPHLRAARTQAMLQACIILHLALVSDPDNWLSLFRAEQLHDIGALYQP